MPACRVGAWELAAGKGQSRNAALQAKTVLRGLQTNGWGLGLAIATQHGMTRQHTLTSSPTLACGHRLRGKEGDSFCTIAGTQAVLSAKVGSC